MSVFIPQIEVYICILHRNGLSVHLLPPPILRIPQFEKFEAAHGNRDTVDPQPIPYITKNEVRTSKAKQSILLRRYIFPCGKRAL